MFSTLNPVIVKVKKKKKKSGFKWDSKKGFHAKIP